MKSKYSFYFVPGCDNRCGTGGEFLCEDVPFHQNVEGQPDCENQDCKEESVCTIYCRKTCKDDPDCNNGCGASC